MKILTSLLIVFLFIVGCKREKMWFNDTNVEGTILDSATLEPLKDIEVVLYREKRKSSFLGTHSKRIDIKKRDSDINGIFKIKFNRVDNRDYNIEFNNIEKLYPKYYLYVGNRLHLHSDIDSFIKYGPFIYVVER